MLVPVLVLIPVPPGPGEPHRTNYFEFAFANLHETKVHAGSRKFTKDHEASSTGTGTVALVLVLVLILVSDISPGTGPGTAVLVLVLQPALVLVLVYWCWSWRTGIPGVLVLTSGTSSRSTLRIREEHHLALGKPAKSTRFVNVTRAPVTCITFALFVRFLIV